MLSRSGFTIVPRYDGRAAVDGGAMRFVRQRHAALS
jgi:hypothetical protein